MHSFIALILEMKNCSKLLAKKYLGTMKNAELRFSIALIAFLGILLSSCGPSASTETVDIQLKLAGEMLFEGANTLQFSGESHLKELADELGAEIGDIKNVAVSSAVLNLDDSSREITESLLLQLVSDNQMLITIGTLSPLPSGNAMTLSLAEDTSILPYLKDDGLTWVLDLNINEDQMDEMNVLGTLSLTVDYIPSIN